MEKRLHNVLIVIILLVGSNSCVSYLPPSSLHHDAIQNRHPIIKDSLIEKSQIVYANIYRLKSGFHHRRDPEIEDNKAWGVQGGFGYAQRSRSAGLSLGYSEGHMFDNDGNKYGHSNLILRGSYSFDFHEGRWNGHIIKLQGAASRGYGRYQNLLEMSHEQRDEFNLMIADGKWFYSLSYGSQFYYALHGHHDLGFGLYFNYSTDFEADGFHAEFFNMELDYLYRDKYRLNLGGMLDARFTPRGETIYLGIGYQFSF